jgi:hypothetical protein
MIQPAKRRTGEVWQSELEHTLSAPVTTPLENISSIPYSCTSPPPPPPHFLYRSIRTASSWVRVSLCVPLFFLACLYSLTPPPPPYQLFTPSWALSFFYIVLSNQTSPSPSSLAPFRLCSPPFVLLVLLFTSCISSSDLKATSFTCCGSEWSSRNGEHVFWLLVLLFNLLCYEYLNPPFCYEET